MGRVLKSWTARVRRSTAPPGVRDGIRELRIAELKRAAAGTGESAVAAQRMLEHAFVSLSFYLRNELAGQGRDAHVRAVMAVAAAIRNGGA